MKKIIKGLLLIVLCSNSYFSSGQLMLNSYNMVADEPIGIDLTVKTATLPNGVQLEYAEQGSFTGTPVIFLHGLSDSWHSFESVLSFLPDNIHAFAISQRGHGDSDRPLTGYTTSDFAGDVAAFIQLQGLKSAFIVGHSMGGVIVQQFAITYPDLVKGIVIIDSDASFKDNPGFPEFYNEVMKLNGPLDRKFMDDFQKSTLANPIDPVYYNTLVTEGMKVPVSVFKAACSGMIEVDFRNDLKQIKAPALIFWGEKDNYCSMDDQEILVAGIPDAKLIVYEGTGHALHWEKPARFTTDLLYFIKNTLTTVK